MLQEKLKALHLPDLLTFADGTPVRTAADWPRRRAELLDVMQTLEYGRVPQDGLHVTHRELDDASQKNTFAGKAVSRRFEITAENERGSASFPFDLIYPAAGGLAPVIVHIAFDPLPHHYLPLEEVIDRGFAVVNLHCNDVTLDKNEFESGVAKLFGPHVGDAPGKLAMWAWGASRVLDCLETLGCVDTRNAAVLGHSRLGKAALLCGALDERFRFVFPNDSGCCGTSLSRGKRGETVRFIHVVFPYWFCANFAAYAGEPCPELFQKRAAADGAAWYEAEFINGPRSEDKMPFDQHFLAAAVAPRYLCAGGAQEDDWADPQNECLCLLSLKPVYELLGGKGPILPDRFLQPGETCHDGDVGLHLRAYGHYLSRYDWNRYLDFMQARL